MGLLDDAIREHLELKRRRGADAVEISRLESEALGPVRRSPAGVPDLTEGADSEPAAAELEPATAEPPAESAGADRPPWGDSAAAAGRHDPSPPPSAHQPPPASTPQPPPASTPTPYKPPVFPASPPEPPPTSILSPQPIEPERSPTLPAEPEEQPAPVAEQPTPSLLSRFKPARRRHAREPARDDPPPAAFVPPAAPAPADDDDPPPAPAAHEPGDEPDPEDLLEETPEFLEETPEHDRLWFEQRPPRDFDFDG